MGGCLDEVSREEGGEKMGLEILPLLPLFLGPSLTQGCPLDADHVETIQEREEACLAAAQAGLQGRVRSGFAWN